MITNDPWMLAMLRGDFAAAWRISDRILHERRANRECCHHWPRHQQYVWLGEPLDDRRVLVRCYHGLGDTIQFVRLLGQLHQRVREITLWAQPALLDLLRTVRGVDRIVPLHEGMPDCEYDADVELMEIPHVLRLSRRTIPAEVPYIYVSRAPRLSRAGELNVGLAWQSGEWDNTRSVPDDLVAPLGAISGVKWHSLQFGVSDLPLRARVMACRDIGRMAARMTALDLVISVDTMTAHLAGALGLRTWTLLPAECDWRWMSSGELSPWYPTMRLFRQPHPGDWHSVIEKVRSLLSAEAAAIQIIPARDTRSTGCTVSSG